MGLTKNAILMKQELTNSMHSINSETKPDKKSKITTTQKLNQELELLKNQDTLLSNLINGKTLTEIIQDKKLNPLQMSLMTFYSILKKNKELNDKVVEARKIGVQTLIDKLLQVFQYEETTDPNAILFLREKTKFVQYLAGHITDLYSDNKVQNVKTDQSIKISWESVDDNIIDVNATDVPASTPIKD